MKVKVANAILVLVIALELGMLVYIYILDQHRPTRPKVRFDALETATAEEVREFESGLNFNDPSAWLQLAEVYWAMGLLPSADYCYRECQKRSPSSPDILYYWGLCLSQKGELQRSSEKFSQAIKLGSHRAAQSWYMIGRNALRAENPGSAYPALLQASRHNEMAAIMLTRLLMRTGRLKDALKLIDGVLHDEPNHMIANQFKSWAEERSGNNELAAYHEHISRRCAPPEKHNLPGTMKCERIIQRFGSARLCAAGVKAAKSGDYEVAVELLRWARNVNWRDMYSVLLAQFELAAENTSGVTEALRDSIDRTGPTSEKLELLGDVAAKRGEADQAREMWLRAADLPASQNPASNYTVHEKLADAYRLGGDPERAAHHNALAYYEKGKFAWRSSDVNAALAEFERATHTLTKHTHAWFYLGEARRASNNPDAARRAYRRCLEINPNHGRAAQRLALLES